MSTLSARVLSPMAFQFLTCTTVVRTRQNVMQQASSTVKMKIMPKRPTTNAWLGLTVLFSLSLSLFPAMDQCA